MGGYYLEEKDIYKENGFYIIRKEINGQMIEFARFSNLNDAIEERDELEEYGWPYLPPEPDEKEPEEDYGQYISKKDGKFIVSRVIRGEEKVFGTFDTLEDAKDFKYRLIEHAWDPSFSRIKSKYGKFIVKERRNFLISRNINGKPIRFGVYKTLDEALSAREKLIDDNWGVDGDIYYFDQTKYGENITFEFDYFRIKKSFNGNLIDFGRFDTLENATIARDILVENDWDISKIPDYLFSIDFFISYRPLLYVYEVSNNINGDLISFGFFSIKEDAELAVKILIDNDWKSSSVPISLYSYHSFIYSKRNFFYVVRKINERLIFYDKFDNESDAIYLRDKLLLSDWNIVENDSDEEKYDDFIYLKSDGKFYVKFEVDGEIRVYGIYDDYLDANQARLDFMKKGWKLPYLYVEESPKKIEKNIVFDDVYNIFKSIELVEEPRRSFPLEKNLNKFIDICKSLYHKKMTQNELKSSLNLLKNEFNNFIDIGLYLGVINKENYFYLTHEGLKIFYKEDNEIYLSIVKLILQHKSFYDVFELYLERDDIPDENEIFEILKNNGIYKIKRDKDIMKRTTLVESWIKWIIALYD